MDDEPKVPDEDADPAQGGVFGNSPYPGGLAEPAARRGPGRPPHGGREAPPRRHPGQAPRRPCDSRAGWRAASPGGPASGREAAGVTSTPEKAAEAAEGSGRGLEDVAWAAIAAAAEAATVGVRLAGRAFEALRETVERR